MSRTVTPQPVGSVRPQGGKAPRSRKPKESMRDFVEQIVIAFILAFLIRGFDAEAFVIPTGSMAPTLMGRHKEVICPECGYQYAINASDETEEFIVSRRLKEVGVCGNCRYRTDVDATPSFKGDRILVMKFPYELPFLPGSAGPKRWDVVVFHYPEKPETNYIKRARRAARRRPPDQPRRHPDPPHATNASFGIERKPLIHQDAMQMLVYDDAHRPKAFADKPEWRRWRQGTRLGRSDPGDVLGQARPTPPPGSTSATATSSPTPSSGRAVEGKKPDPARPPGHADHRLLLVQHQHQPGLLRPLAAGARGLSAAQLGRRPDRRRARRDRPRRRRRGSSGSTWSRRASRTAARST